MNFRVVIGLLMIVLVFGIGILKLLYPVMFNIIGLVVFAVLMVGGIILAKIMNK